MRSKNKKKWSCCLEDKREAIAFFFSFFLIFFFFFSLRDEGATIRSFFFVRISTLSALFCIREQFSVPTTHTHTHDRQRMPGIECIPQIRCCRTRTATQKQKMCHQLPFAASFSFLLFVCTKKFVKGLQVDATNDSGFFPLHKLMKLQLPFPFLSFEATQLAQIKINKQKMKQLHRMSVLPFF
jgi:hypothetical protein